MVAAPNSIECQDDSDFVLQALKAHLEENGLPLISFAELLSSEQSLVLRAAARLKNSRRP